MPEGCNSGFDSICKRFGIFSDAFWAAFASYLDNPMQAQVAIPVFNEIMCDPNPHIETWAVESLRKIGTKEALNAIQQHKERKEQFLVGVILANGNLLPIGLYDHGRWSNPWPQANQKINTEKYEKIEQIPTKWFSPLNKMPVNWHYQTFNPKSGGTLLMF